MAKRNTKSKDAIVSGRVGGPATFGGINYQTEYAVLRALDLIAINLVIHGPRYFIGVEPRIISDGGVTAWDIVHGPPETVVEAKETPNASDVIEFLKRISAAKDSGAIFRLVYSKSSTPIISALYRMRYIALESGEDHDKFNLLVSHEQLPRGDAIQTNLGPNAFALLKRMETEDLSREALSRELQRAARLLAGAKSQQLIDLLFRKLAVSAPGRLSLSADALVAEAKDLGIELYSSPVTSVADTNRQALPILFCLQSCKTEIPKEVVADALGQTQATLEALLQTIPSLLTNEGPFVSMRRLPTPIHLENGDHILGQLLRALLSFIERNKKSPEGRNQISNALALARACGPANNAIVAFLFDAVEKPLKRVGNKLLLFEASDISIRAVRSTTHPTVKMRETEAKALICGNSWVYQRMGETEKARVFANESLKLGDDVGYDRNTAYCKKCIGRLCRIEAEQVTAKNERDARLQESCSLLIEAIRCFSNHPDFGPDSAEVGDCYSLLGRTYLVMGEVQQAEEAIRKADDRLDAERDSKDYLDLLILKGDLLAHRKLLDAADEAYASALKLGEADNAEKNEMMARAHFGRGLNQLRMNRRSQAIESLRLAAAMWKDLGELEPAAKTEWHLLELEAFLPKSAQDALSKERFMVRMEVANIYRQILHNADNGVQVARRNDPGPSFWKKLITEARKKVALEITHF